VVYSYPENAILLINNAWTVCPMIG
jgi:hypothetical protein